MKKLRKLGLIEMNEEASPRLTEKGRKAAELVYERHRLLTHLLIQMGVPPDQAEQDACRVEHDLSEESFQAIKHGLQLYGKYCSADCEANFPYNVFSER